MEYENVGWVSHAKAQREGFASQPLIDCRRFGAGCQWHLHGACPLGVPDYCKEEWLVIRIAQVNQLSAVQDDQRCRPLACVWIDGEAKACRRQRGILPPQERLPNRERLAA